MLTAGYGRSQVFEVILTNTLLSAERRVLLGANISPAFTKKILAKTKESIFDKPKSFSSGCQIMAILLIHLGDTLTNFLEIQSCCICGVV